MEGPPCKSIAGRHMCQLARPRAAQSVGGFENAVNQQALCNWLYRVLTVDVTHRGGSLENEMPTELRDAIRAYVGSTVADDKRFFEVAQNLRQIAGRQWRQARENRKIKISMKEDMELIQAKLRVDGHTYSHPARLQLALLLRDHLLPICTSRAFPANYLHDLPRRADIVTCERALMTKRYQRTHNIKETTADDIFGGRPSRRSSERSPRRSRSRSPPKQRQNRPEEGYRSYRN